MTADAGHEGRIDVAIRRLERATALLEQRLAHKVAEAGANVGGLFDRDRAQLAAELDAARGRAHDLAAAGEVASTALAKAIAEIKATLGETGA